MDLMPKIVKPAALKALLPPVSVGMALLLILGYFIFYPLVAEIWQLKEKNSALQRENLELEKSLVQTAEAQKEWETREKGLLEREFILPEISRLDQVLAELEELFREVPVEIPEVLSGIEEREEDEAYLEARFRVSVAEASPGGGEELLLFLQELENFPYPLVIHGITLHRESRQQGEEMEAADPSPPFADPERSRTGGGDEERELSRLEVEFSLYFDPGESRGGKSGPQESGFSLEPGDGFAVD